MEVMMSSSVQECSLMENDNGNGDLNLNKSKRKRRRKAHKRQSDENLGSLEKTDPNISIGISTSVDKMSAEKSTSMAKDLNGEVEVQMKMEAVIGETSAASNVIDNTTSKRRKRKKMENNNPDLGDSLSTRESAQAGSSMTKVLGEKCDETVLGQTTTLDEHMGSKEQDHAEVANGKTGESETTDLNVNGKEKRKKKRKLKNKQPTLAEISYPQYVRGLEASKRARDSGTISTNNSASKRETMQKLNKNPDLGDILSTHESTQEGLSTAKVLELKSGETVSAKAAAPDANLMSKGDHTEDANGKTGESETTNLNVNGKGKKKRKAKSEITRPTLAEISNPQYLQNLEAARGETDSGTTSIGNSAIQQRTREKMMNNNPDLGDMLSTRESMHEGLSTTKVFEVKSGETVLANTATLDANIVSNGDHADVSGKAGESETANLNVNGKEKKKRKPKSKNKRPTLGEILNPRYLQNLEAAKTGSGTTSTDNRASKKHKRQRLNGNSDVGDILSTHESTHEGLSTTKGDHLEVVNDKMQVNETNNLNVKGKKKKKKKPKSKNNETGLESTDIESVASPQVANSEMGSTTIVLKEITHVATLGKKLIILDVNGLLADVLTERPKDIVADKYIPRRAIFKRPYLDDFLCFCFERFEVGIWSSRAMKNLVPVINFLLGDLKKKLLFLWDSCKCTDSGIGTLEVKHKHVVVKDLRKIWDEDGPKKSWVKGTFHESNTLLVDDSPYKKHTGIFPTSYSYKNRDDNFLAPKGELQTYLEGLAGADDVKTYVEQHPFGQGAIDEHSPHWAFYSSIIERLNNKNIMESLYKKSHDKRRRCHKDFYHPS
ncbi:uncharacterized protein LOC110915875 isoform X2 [Helianthus annuus]|uniref:uncharacterized protein LOC110915875 isoform X2 n=1 Tax=Helianthus annuus TaxID=4232 RepID=UPI001652E188|nr:uncharacterized protein LOC110915875 isoform X2 [Helianthus annuus]